MRNVKTLLAAAVAVAASAVLVSCSASGESNETLKSDDKESSNNSYIGENEEADRSVAWSHTVEAFLKENNVTLYVPEAGEPNPADYHSYLGTLQNCQIQFLTTDIETSPDGKPNTFIMYENTVQQSDNVEALPSAAVKTDSTGTLTMWGLKYSQPNLTLKDGAALPGSEEFNPETDLVEDGTVNTIKYFVADNTPKSTPNAPEDSPAAAVTEPTASSVTLTVSCLNSTPEEVFPALNEQLESNANLALTLKEQS